MGFVEEKLPDIPAEDQNDVYCFLYDLNHVPGFEACRTLLEQCREGDFHSVNISRIFSRFGDSITGNIIRMYLRNRYFNDSLQDEIGAALKQIPDLDMEKPPAAMGLLTGYAGEGLLRLAALNQTNLTWINLL